MPHVKICRTITNPFVPVHAILRIELYCAALHADDRIDIFVGPRVYVKVKGICRQCSFSLEEEGQTNLDNAVLSDNASHLSLSRSTLSYRSNR